MVGNPSETQNSVTPASISYGADDIPFVPFPNPSFVPAEDLVAIAAALVVLAPECRPLEGTSPWNAAGRIEAIAQLRSMV